MQAVKMGNLNKKVNFIELAKKVIKEAGKPLSAREVWSQVKAQGLEGKLKSDGKTPAATMGARLYNAALDDRNASIRSIGQRPKRFYIPGVTPDAAVRSYSKESPEEDIKTPTFKEKDLHQVLAYFVFEHMDSFAKTIVHSTSRKQRYGQWTHPDMVACWFPRELWNSEAFELSKAMGDVQLSLLSFEIKQQLGFSNLRESFFQAVSNSTWANEGYLVAATIDDTPEFHSELRRLSGSFGVGVIRLDVEEPDNSEIILPAEEREYLDWEMINKLMINKDFKSFINRIKNDLASREIRRELYDEVKDPEDLKKYFQKYQ